MNEPIYRLQKYTGIDSRHTCPHCGHKREWTLYVDANNKPIAPGVGKCNRGKCGGHTTPSEYFKQNPTGKSDFSTWKQPKPARVIPTSYLPSSLIRPDSYRDKNNLFRFMAKEFGHEAASIAFDAYRVGTSKHWRNADGLAAAFPQIDELGRVRQIKVMAYNPDTGKRMKKQDSAKLWIDREQKYVPDTRSIDKIWFAGKSILKNQEANLQQTFFGSHLVNEAEHIGILESEKSALICSILMPSILWIATGGCNGCRWTEQSALELLRGKRIVLYPDSGMKTKWEDKAAILRNGGVDISVSSICEGYPDNTDVADILLRERHMQKGMTIGEVLAYANEIGVINQIHIKK